jgi:hypothetical protein
MTTSTGELSRLPAAVDADRMAGAVRTLADAAFPDNAA